MLLVYAEAFFMLNIDNEHHFWSDDSELNLFANNYTTTIKKSNMKKIILVLVLISVSVLNINAQTFCSDSEHKIFNKIYNDYIYLYKNVNVYIQNNNVQEIVIYSGSKVLKIFTFGEVSNDKKLKALVFFTTDSTDQVVTRVRLKNINKQYKVVDISNNDLKMINDSRVVNFSKDHVQFMCNNNKVSHDQNGFTFQQRIKKFEIDHYGTFRENCSQDNNFIIHTTDVKRVTSIIKSYFIFRFKSVHWKTLMDVEIIKYETFYLHKHYTIYSMTIMLDGELKQLALK